MSGGATSPSMRHLGDTPLLRAHARWILVLALVTVVSAILVAWVVQRPEYRTEAKVVVGPRLPTGGGPFAPDMETEVQVVTSGVVLSAAARDAGGSPAYLRRRLSVTVPADSTVLRLRYADRTPETARLRATAIAEAYTTYRAGQASLLSAPTTPRSATGPDYLLAGVAGLTLGVLIGVGSALARDLRDDRLRGADDFERVTGLPVLTCVPREPSTPSNDLRPTPSPGSRAAESYRFLRTRLMQAVPGRLRTDQATRGPTVVMVTSAVRDDGAMRVAANGAVALAVAGRHVVLIPGDLAGSGLLASPEPDVGSGLVEVLAGRARVDQVLRVSAVEGLTLMPRGADAEDVGELLNPRSLRRLVDQLPKNVEFVVVQSPPILTAAESLVWADVADEVVIVATVGVSTRRDLAAALRELRRMRGPLLGGVLLDGPPLLPAPLEAAEATHEAAGPLGRIAQRRRAHTADDGSARVAGQATRYVRPGS